MRTEDGPRPYQSVGLSDMLSCRPTVTAEDFFEPPLPRSCLNATLYRLLNVRAEAGPSAVARRLIPRPVWAPSISTPGFENSGEHMALDYSLEMKNLGSRTSCHVEQREVSSPSTRYKTSRGALANLGVYCATFGPSAIEFKGPYLGSGRGRKLHRRQRHPRHTEVCFSIMSSSRAPEPFRGAVPTYPVLPDRR